MTVQWHLRNDSEEATLQHGGADQQSSYKKVWIVGVIEDAGQAHTAFSEYLDGTGGVIQGKFGPYFFNYDHHTARHLGNGYWEVEASYVTAGGGEQPQSEANGGGGPPKIGVITHISFDTSGGMQHITSALSESRYGKFGEGAPDMKMAIGVNGDSVEGTDIVVPVFEWGEDYEIPGGRLTLDYVKTVADLTGKINNAAFRGFDVGEVLFLGCSGAQTYNPNAESFAEASVAKLTFRFARKPNAPPASIEIGDIVPFGKGGWDYMWIRYGDEVADGVGLKRPLNVYVNKVYESGDFDLLRLP